MIFRSSTGETLIKRGRVPIVLSTAQHRGIEDDSHELRSVHTKRQCVNPSKSKLSPVGCVTYSRCSHPRPTLHTSKLLGSGRRRFREPSLRPELYVGRCVSSAATTYMDIRVTVLAHPSGQARQTDRQTPPILNGSGRVKVGNAVLGDKGWPGSHSLL